MDGLSPGYKYTTGILYQVYQVYHSFMKHALMGSSIQGIFGVLEISVMTKIPDA